MKLAALSKRKTLVVDFDGESLTLVYDPSGITIDLEEQMSAPGQAQSAAAAHFVHAIVEEWDLEHDDNTPVSLDTESLKMVPLMVLVRVIDAIREDALPSSAEGKASSDGSLQTATSGTPQSGSLS